MQRFTDKQGGEWCVLVTDQALEELRRNAQIDLATLGMSAGEAIQERMGQDASVVVVCLLAICKGQRLQRQIPQDQFGQLVEEVYPAARDALLDALIDWPTNAAMKARLRRAARAIRADWARPKEEPQPKLTVETNSPEPKLAVKKAPEKQAKDAEAKK